MKTDASLSTQSRSLPLTSTVWFDYNPQAKPGPGAGARVLDDSETFQVLITVVETQVIISIFSKDYFFRATQ